jgi:hypothetical protein
MWNYAKPRFNLESQEHMYKNGKVYKTLVLNALLYNSETWMLKETTKKKTESILNEEWGIGQT